MLTYAAIAMLLAAAALRTRIGRLYLALRLLRLSNALHDAGARIIDNAEADHHG